ncbi:hypothetical protein LFYK43_19960 [Ligilactobacillus salitolerans]|uniref:ABM domain-containing protein n=1 Tax=Ligilactobacillus salitolerans TaxID=1808352 RepID=A0A401IVM4_9LACO|nr:hypothetical protein [Ligilactobacillus salitolerans]GBG95537.1 hypothetical protein LFYK43_19960 [Ligilactobacillus salitolerans]
MAKVETMHYRVLKKNHDKMIAALVKALDYQKAHPSLIHYSLSRTWYRPVTDDPTQEIWMFMDESNDHEQYATTMKTAESDDQAGDFRQQFISMVIPDKPFSDEEVGLNHVVWEEIPELHVELPENNQ